MLITLQHMHALAAVLMQEVMHLGLGVIQSITAELEIGI